MQIKVRSYSMLKFTHVLENPVHGVPTWLEQKLVNLHGRYDLVNPGHPCRFLAVLDCRFAEGPHDLGVQLRHEDLNCLVRLHVHPPGHVPVQRVQCVEVPAVPVEGAHAVGGAVVGENPIEQSHLVVEGAVRLHLEVGALKVLA